jgi:GNAT superfamily N-acetyltransferase
VHRSPGVAVAVFVREPERAVYNNALLSRGLDAHGRVRALAALEDAYAQAGIARFAAWVHETDDALRINIEQRGYILDTTTRAMGIDLDDLQLPRPDIDLAPAQWSEYLRREGLPPDFLEAADHAAFHVLAAHETADEAGPVLAAALAYDFGTDCGIYNVGTVERARRRGLGSAITLAQLYAARDRGCRTASLQATPMAERLYAQLGFRDLGRFLEYVRP